MSEVEVLFAEEEATTKSGTLESEEVAFTEKSPHGEVVAIPTLPANMEVEVAVKVPVVRLPTEDDERNESTKRPIVAKKVEEVACTKVAVDVDVSVPTTTVPMVEEAK